MKLGLNPPAWARSYIGIPFAPRGRDVKGADCWGLARLIYAEQLQIILPRLDDQYADLQNANILTDVLDRERSHWQPVTQEELQVGDMMTATLARGCPHVGVVVAQDGVLHTIEATESAYERLTSPRLKPRITGFFRYAGPVLLQGRPDPFRSDPISVTIPHGLSITELLAASGIEPSPHLRVWVNNRECPREHWSHVRPKPGRQVRVCAVPAGGGGGNKGILRIVLIIVIIVAAIVAPYIMAPLFASGTFFTAAGALTMAGTLLSAGVMMVGMLAVNALIPPAKPKFGSEGVGLAASPSIAGTRNSARPWSAIPCLFGDMRIAPAYGARPFTETVGDNQYLRCLFVPCYGRVEFSEPRIGETDLDFFEDVEIEYREGLTSDTPVTLYPETVVEEGFSLLLSKVDGWVIRTSTINATQISIDLTFSQGLAHWNDDGSKTELSVALEVEYSPTGTNTWTVAVPPFTITAAQGELLRRSIAWTVPLGQYDVRIRRTTDDRTSNRDFDKVYFSVLRTFRASDPVLLPGVAKIAMRIKATGQLNGVVDQFSIRCKSIVLDWDAATQTYIERVTSNPASHYLAMLRGRGVKEGRGLADARIDLEELKVWHGECIANGWEFNGIFDAPTTVNEALARIASAGRATPGMRDGLHSIVRDRIQSTPRQLLTPRNSFGFKGSKAFPDLPHALRIRFLDRDSGWTPKERIVLADGYSQLNKDGDRVDAFGNLAPTLPLATVFNPMDLDGVTSADQAWKHGRYFLAVATHRPEIYALNTDVESLVSSRGDLVLVQHDVAMWGEGSGRIENLVTDTLGNLHGVTIDEELSLGLQYSYRLRVRLANGEIWHRDLERAEGIFRQLTFAQYVPVGEAMPASGDLFAFGQVGLETRELLIKSISWDRDLAAELTLIDYSPQIHQADQGTIPPWDPGISTGQDYTLRPETPIIEQIASDETVMYRGADGSLQPRMVITLRIPSSRRPMGTHAQVRLREKAGAGQTPWSWRVLPLIPIEGGNVSILEVEQGILYEIRIRSVTPAGLTSLEAIAEHRVVGKTLPPPDVTSLNVVRLSDGTRRYSWVATSPPDLAGFRLRYGPAGSVWNNMTALHSGLVQVNPSELNEPDAGTWRFGIKAVDTSGNESLNMAYVEKTLGPPRTEGVAISEDAGLIGWPGTKVDCHIAETILEADDTATWDTLASMGVNTWDQWARWNLSPRSPISYTHTLDAGFVLDFSPDAIVAGDGVLSVEVASSIDGATWTEYRSLELAKAESVTGRYMRAKVTCVAASGFPIPTITRVLVLMRAPAVVHEINDLDTATLGGLVVATGDVYLPVPVGMFNQVRSVSVSFVAGGGGRSCDLVSRDPVLGPRVRLYDSTGQLAHAVIDARISGV